MPDEAEMPKYKCHKTVWALKIKQVIEPPEGLPNGPYQLIFEEDKIYAPMIVSVDFIEKHEPKAGGYYVVYEDGYKSFSPAKAFEDGYTRI